MRTARLFSVLSALVTGAALTLTSATVVRADGLIRDGIGAISVGRGGTNLGFADNGTIIHDNPAGMMNIKGSHLLDVGIDGVITDLEYHDADNGVKGRFNIFPSGVLGYVHRKPHSPVAFGFGMYAPAGFGARYRMNNPDFGYSHYNSIGALAKLLPSAAVQVTDRLAVGGSFGLGIGHVELEGPFYTQTGPMQGTPSLFDLQGTAATTTWNLGLQYDLSPATRLGVAYTSQTRFDFDGDANATLLLGGVPVVSDFDAETTLIWPQSLGIGLQHKFCDCRRFGFDVYWYDWSGAYSQLPLRLSNPSNPALGGATITDSFPMNWRDTYSFRFGYEWNTSPTRVWRTGYVFHRSPTPDSTLNPYLDGVLEHAISIGHGRQTRHGWVNLGYQLTWGEKRHVGDSAIIGGDFDNSTFEAAAHWLTISLLR